METHRFELGDLRCVVVNDGYISNIPPQGFFPNAPADQLVEELHQRGIYSDTLSTPCNCLVVDIGTHRVLLETGGGKGHPPYGVYVPGTPRLSAGLGNLIDGLDAEGITPESIDMIILSHAHGDHISGNVDRSGKPLFPNARYFMARGEWEDFTSLSIPDDDEEWDGWAGSVRFAQEQCLAIQDRIQLVEPDAEVVPGVHMILTPGHSVAHCSVEFASGNERLVCTADTTWLIAVEHPEWGPNSEQELDSRLRIHARASKATLVHGYHFPFPGLGRLIPNGDGWRWQAS